MEAVRSFRDNPQVRGGEGCAAMFKRSLQVRVEGSGEMLSGTIRRCGVMAAVAVLYR